MDLTGYEDYLPAPGESVAVAMSGGVDSSVAACLLAERRCRVIGLTLKMFCYSETDPGERSCCNLESIADARAVCASIGAAHYVLESTGPFRELVIEPFVRDYLAGRTPNPCVNCNTFIKFPHALARARALGAERLATGHYARLLVQSGPVAKGEREVLLARGLDPAKDQSYFLWGLERRDLKHYAFPLGGMDKATVRRIAGGLGLTVSQKKESQEVCFLGQGSLEQFIQQHVGSGDTAGTVPGPLLDESGRRIGTHRGAAFYTLGQRRGVGAATGQPAYVIAVDTASNTVVVGSQERLFSAVFLVSRINYLLRAPESEFEAWIKVRYRHKPVHGRVTPLEGNRARVVFDTPQRAVTPGQSAVFYSDSVVLGGGVIDSLETPEPD
ncbi:tRNA 2-thiouridine(34) synthase MnmA [bacterium]|nr:tRNA 2-thiouridine(34) synthase MnmA [bacterium]